VAAIASGDDLTHNEVIPPLSKFSFLNTALFPVIRATNFVTGPKGRNRAFLRGFFPALRFLRFLLFKIFLVAALPLWAIRGKLFVKNSDSDGLQACEWMVESYDQTGADS
jgi:hypothetical protein